MDERIDPAFVPLLREMSFEELERHPESVVGLWPDSRIAYVNPAWNRFAAENGGQPQIGDRWGLGAHYLDAVSDPLRPFHEGLLRRSVEQTTASEMRPVGHEYQCSSARLFRRYHMDVYALRGGQAFLIVNSLVLERPHDEKEHKPVDPEPDLHIGEDGLLHQCSHCRLVQRAREPERWDWVPQWVERPPDNTSHTICPICFEFYYPNPDAA